MTTNAEYQSRIQGYDRLQLLTLWDHIQNNDTPDWEPGRALEYLVIRSFELEGAEVAYQLTVQIGGTIVYDQPSVIVGMKNLEWDDSPTVRLHQRSFSRRIARLLTGPITAPDPMVYPLQDRYISLLTDFGFKRIFGTEPNKRLLIDFLNTLLPAHHHIQDLTFKNTEQLGSKTIDRKAIFDIYCQAQNGDRFIVEIQKAKQNFFKDRSIYYATFPIQEQALKGEWDYELSAVYSVGVLDFIFDDHKTDKTFLHVVELKNQRCEVFYKKLKFIYIELPKFTKTLDQLESHFDKWIFLLRHLAELTDRPQPLQEGIFPELFAAAEIANFSRTEQDTYQNSLKYYRDMNNVVDTARQEGRQEGIELERSRVLERQRSLLLRLLPRTLGKLPDPVQTQIGQLSSDQLEMLNEEFVDFTNLDDLLQWLDRA